MTTIASLVVEASLNPAGIGSGLNEGMGYMHRFTKAVQREFANLGDQRDGEHAAQQIIQGLEREFQRAQTEIREDLFRGLTNPQRAAADGTRVAQAFNAALLQGLDAFRGAASASGDRALTLRLPAIERDFVASLSSAGKKGADALQQQFMLEMQRGEAEMAAIVKRSASALSAGIGTTAVNSMNRLGIATTAATFGLTRFQGQAGRTAIAVAFAAEQWANGTESAARTGLRAIGTFALAFGPEGLIVTAIATGTLAVLDFFHKTEKEAEETLKRIADLANTAQADQLRTMGRNLLLGTPFDDKGKLRERSQVAANAFVGSLADLEGKLRQAERNVKEAPTVGAVMEAQRRVKELERELEPLRREFAKIREATLNLANQPSEMAGKLPGVTVTAKAPGAKEKPFADLAKEVDVLTTAYEQMRSQGIAPSLALQTELENALTKTGNLLANIKDQASPAANALRKIQADIIAAGIHANDFLLPSSKPLVLTLQTGKADEVAQALAGRVQSLRDAFGEFNLEVMSSETQLANMLRGVDVQIEQQGGILRASDDLVKARAILMKAIADAAQGQFSEIWTPDLAANLQQTISSTLKEIKGEGDKTNEMWEAMRVGIQGVIDAADGLGLISQDLRQMGSGALHLMGSFKQIVAFRRQSAMADEASKRAESGFGFGGPETKGPALAAQLGAYMGAIGAGISLISGVMGLISTHNEILDQNNRRLLELRNALIDTEGVGGQQKAQTALLQFQKESAGTPTLAVGKRLDILEGALADAGLSLEQFKKIAADLGITIGLLSPAEVAQFMDALRLATSAATRYTNSLDDQRSLMELHNKVFQLSTPEDSIAATIGLLDQFAPVLAEGLKGIDTATAEGQAALREALKNLVTMIEQGAITPEMLGSLTGVKDLAGLILSISDSLESLGNATDKATQSMTNVPPWYKVAAVRFASAAPESPMGGAAQKPFAPYAPTPTPLPTGGGMQMTFTGDIIVPVAAKDPVQLFREMLRVAQQASQTQFGTTTKWSQLQSI